MTHPIFDNSAATWARRFARTAPAEIEVPEWGPNADTPYLLHLRPAKGVDVDSFQRYQPSVEPFKWAVEYLMATCIDPVDQQPIFTAEDRAAFYAIDDPALVVKIARRAMVAINERYPMDPEKVKEPSSNQEGDS